MTLVRLTWFPCALTSYIEEPCLVSAVPAFPRRFMLIMEYIALATAMTTEIIAMTAVAVRPPASIMTVIRRAFPMRHFGHKPTGIFTPSLTRVRYAFAAAASVYAGHSRSMMSAIVASGGRSKCTRSITRDRSSRLTTRSSVMMPPVLNVPRGTIIKFFRRGRIGKISGLRGWPPEGAHTGPPAVRWYAIPGRRGICLHGTAAPGKKGPSRHCLPAPGFPGTSPAPSPG